jgi:CheY-like chemotaxis protein
MPIKILAIDDSKTMRLAIKITFAAEDAQVVAVSKGSEAIPRAKQHGADIILIDHTLAAGEPSGLQVVQELKANPATAKIPVILMIPARGGTTEAEALAAGADAAIGKPFDTQDLIDRVNAVISGQKVASTTAPAKTPAVTAPAGGKPPVAATPAGGKPPVAATAPGGTPAGGKPPVTTPVAAPPGGKPPVAATPAGGKPPVAATPAGGKPPVATTPTPAGGKPPVAATAPAGGKPPVAATAPGGKPPVTATPAAATAVKQPTAAAQPVAARAPAGPIPIARPIPFTAANSPTAGMLERLRAANGGAAAGLDPAAVRALLQLSQEVIEQVVWEVVPDLAELLIKEQMRQQQSR